MTIEIKKNQLFWYKRVYKSKWKGLTQTWPIGTKYHLWDPKQDINNLPSIEWYGGIDVHLKELTVALFGIDLNRRSAKILGPIISVKTTIQGYQKLFAIYDFFSPIRILMETTGIYSFDPYHRCVAKYPAKKGKNRVICMNAHDLSRLLVKNKKMDKIDAARLAFLASVPELLRESYIPTREEYVLRFMLRQRNRYKKDLTKIKNRIKTFLSAGGLKWRFNFNINGEIGIIKGFIEQTKDLGCYLAHLEVSLDIDKDVKSAIQKHGQKLAQWADFTLSDMERLNLIALIGFLEKLSGLVDMYDKLVYETLIRISRFHKKWDLLKDMPGAGPWALATIILESGPISRFSRVGSYLSYIGVTKGIHESANVSVKKGNNPHSHRILKHAYRTVGIALLGMVIKAEKAKENIIFHQCHPLIEYARKINTLPILNGKKANKIAAKAARIAYGILKSEKPYNCLHENKQSTLLADQGDDFTHVVRYSMMNNQINLLRTSYQTIAERSCLMEEPYMSKLLLCCKKVVDLWDSTPILSELRKSFNLVRTIKRHSKASFCKKKKTHKKKKDLKRNKEKHVVQDGKGRS